MDQRSCDLIKLPKYLRNLFYVRCIEYFISLDDECLINIRFFGKKLKHLFPNKINLRYANKVLAVTHGV